MQQIRFPSAPNHCAALAACRKEGGVVLKSVRKYLQAKVQEAQDLSGNGLKQRYWEIDFLRGIALLMMVIFHVVFDLWYFDIFPVSTSDGFWRYFGYATTSLFLLIVGVSFTISYARVARSLSRWQICRKFIFRGAGIFILGVLITLGTWLYLGDGYVVFGILQLIGISIILATLFYRFGTFNIVWGVFFIATGLILGGFAGPIWMLPLGIHPASFWSVDYTPLFPWFGPVLIGIGIGSYLYPAGYRRFQLPARPGYGSLFLIIPGTYSLFVYFVHQPVILLILSVITGKVPLL